MAALMVLSGCASMPYPAGPSFRSPPPPHYAQSLDSATSGCLRTPACYSQTPDVVIHAAGDPLKVQRIYDLKFPCPVGKPPSWSSHAAGPLSSKRDQEKLYEELAGTEPSLIHPLYGVQ